MKRDNVLIVLLTVCLAGATAQAQQTEPAPQQRGANGDVLNLIGVLGALQQQGGQRGPGGFGAGQRGGGGIGPGTANPQATVNPDGLSAVRIEDGRVGRRIELANAAYNLALAVPGGAWWTNTALVTRLGLTDDQKLKIERVYESHRQNLVSTKDALEREESQLAKLLEADTLDRTASIAQIYKVVQARGEMEKTNSLMTFEMREVLTRAQWTQLQAQQPTAVPVLDGLRVVVQPGPGLRGGGARGARGQ